MVEAKPHAIFSFDVDGVICELPDWEEVLTGITPFVVEGVQRLFQRPGLLFALRQERSLAYLKKRTINDEAVEAIRLLHKEGESLSAETGHRIEIAVATERPVAAHNILLEQLRDKGVADFISHWWENPFGGNFTDVKPNMAQALQRDRIFHAHLEDKRRPSAQLARFGSLSYLRTGIATRLWGIPRSNNIIPVNSCVDAASSFLEKVRTML